MAQQQGVPSAAPKTKGGVPYRIERRTKKKGSSDPLSGFAIDVTIRVNREGAYFLQDHNGARKTQKRSPSGNAMPHNDREELVETFWKELRRNHKEHFGHS